MFAMNALLSKEMRLGASVLSYAFIAFAVMTLIPGYPILLGAFFVSLGIFQTFQKWVITNDILYSVMLPVSKSDIIRTKFVFCILIEILSFILMAILTILRMTVLSGADVYVNNALMAANLTFLGFALIIFGFFNLVFVGGFFKTSYKFGKPFILSIIVTFAITIAAEILWHVPGLESLNAMGFDNIGMQAAVLAIGAVLFIVLTFVSVKISISNFEKTDL